jgi:hypothetical protein
MAQFERLVTISTGIRTAMRRTGWMDKLTDGRMTFSRSSEIFESELGRALGDLSPAIHTFLLTARPCWTETLLVCALTLLCLQLVLLGRSTAPFVAELSLRNANYPNTYIKSIQVDLTSPHHWVRLTWLGTEADSHSDESNRAGSNCTPKGTRLVEGSSYFLPTVPTCKYVTWFHVPREIALHSHGDVPNYPASHGCVRLDEYAAQLIHNNSIIAKK